MSWVIYFLIICFGTVWLWAVLEFVVRRPLLRRRASVAQHEFERPMREHRRNLAIKKLEIELEIKDEHGELLHPPSTETETETEVMARAINAGLPIPKWNASGTHVWVEDKGWTTDILNTVAGLPKRKPRVRLRYDADGKLIDPDDRQFHSTPFEQFHGWTTRPLPEHRQRGSIVERLYRYHKDGYKLVLLGEDAEPSMDGGVTGSWRIKVVNPATGSTVENVKVPAQAYGPVRPWLAR